MESVLPLIAVSAALVTQAKGEPITGLFNTGVDASRAELPPGSLDPHWTIITGPGITTPVPAVVTNTQVTYASSPDSQWIWVNEPGARADRTPPIPSA
jgi:hypothetical protein